MSINADEGEPGTFKDRHYLESDPHRFLEGPLIAAWAVGCERCYIYLRDEYPAVREILLQEIAKLAAAGRTKPCPPELPRGAAQTRKRGGERTARSARVDLGGRRVT